MRDKRKDLEALGMLNLGQVYWNLPTPALYEEAVRRREAMMAHLGPLVVRTGQYTGRSPRDKYIVRDEVSDRLIWWGEVNQPMEVETYEALRARVMAYLQGRDVFVQEVYVGADPRYRVSLRVITETAWHALFARNMFIRELDRDKLAAFQPEWTLIHVPHFRAIPELDRTRSEVFVIVNLSRKEVLIGGTSYAGEIKKAMFTVMNVLLPRQGVLSMHCSANWGEGPDDVALFFGLSGTGKTTLSIDSSRTLIGDDEHGWSDEGIFNLEGGSYAKVIRISPEHEPEIYETTRRFGTILENVAIDPVTRRLDLNDASLTENTRAAFPISHLPNATREGRGGHPRVIFFLTADAFGVLPPLARLTEAQAVLYFLLGYTARVAGTERGVKEPQATFSTCFGAPFMALSPTVYANLLRERIRKHGVQVWLVNTGWIEGPYGEGRRIPLPYTRAMVHAVLKGWLDDVPRERDPFFGLEVPVRVPDVPDRVLRPVETWPDRQRYEQTAAQLREKFREAFRAYENEVEDDIRDALP